MPSMNFVLTGRDQLSRVLDRAGDASDRLGRRLMTMSINGDAAVRRFSDNTTRHLAGMQRDTDAGAKSLGELKKAAMLLAPAAIPVAASLAPIAAGAGTVAVAVAAMGAAIAPQIAQLGEAADAEKKWQDAVDKSGAQSQEAVQAQTAYTQAMAKLPPETRKSAAALAVLKDDYQSWSDSLAGDTMAPVTKGLMLTNALLPKTTGLVKATSAETDRFMTIIGGEMASPGLDQLNSRFTNFAQRTLRNVNDELVHLLRASGSGQAGGQAREFMDWARAQGPTVAHVLSSVAGALIHVLEAGSDVGVGLLQVVDVLASIVSAVPPGAIATFLQLALALKVTKAAALGLAAGRTVLVGFAAQLLAMNTAAAATPGRMAAARTSIAALSRTTKVAAAGTGIGLLVIALSELSQRSGQAPPDVDKLTTSLKQLGSTGQATGEAANAFGKDLGGLYDKVRSLTDPSTTDQVQQFLVGWTGWDSTPVKDAKANIDSIDKALANLVQSGDADLAAAAVKRLTAEYGKGGRDTKQFTKELGDYREAIADAKFEQQLAAASMGLFGQQAQSVQTKLDAQKKSADGLRQSIVALNDANRAGLGGMIGFEASIDAAAKAAKENAGALSMSHGQLNLNSEKARTAASSLQDLASKTDEAAGAARESGASWETVNGVYSRGREQFLRSAEAMGLTKAQAALLADQIMKIPDKTARVKMNKEDAQQDLQSFFTALAAKPNAKSVTLKALSKAGEKTLESFGLKVTRLPNGSVTVSAKTGQALSNIGSVQSARDRLSGKTITITTRKVTLISTLVSSSASSQADALRRQAERLGGATGGLYTGRSFKHRGYADGGLVDGPGTDTSDDVFAPWLSKNEFVVNARRTRQYLPLLKAINSGQLTAGSLASGGGTASAGRDAGRGLAAGLGGSTPLVLSAARTMAAAVTAGIREELQIASPSKKTRALMADVGKGMIIGLTGSQAKIKATAKDLAKDIWAAFSGTKDNRLVAYVNAQTKKLLAAAAKRDKIAATIATAKKLASDITTGARENAGLSNLGMDAGEVTAGGIKGGLASKLAQIKQFTRYIDILGKKGLNKGLLRQILNMGPEAGYAYASALVGADKMTFNSINKLQSQVDASTATLGRVGADRMYDSGKNASRGFLAGLTSQQKELEKTMEKIAKAMQKALRKALGIKSPARAMIPDGINTTRGVAVGVLAGLPHVDRAMQAVAGRMAGRAVAAPVAGRAAVFGTGGGTTTVNLSVEAGLGTDPISLAREMRRMLLELKRDYGINVNLGVA